MSPPAQSELEVFDVVDANDVVIGTSTRGQVHREKLFHRAIHIFVFNSQGQVFLQRRSLEKDSAPGKWASACSGHVDSGEDYESSARREMLEELGVEAPERLEPLFKERARRETGNEFVWVYRTEHEGPFVLNEEEIMDGQWIDVEVLDRWVAEKPRDFSWSFVFLWERYRRESGEMQLKVSA
ncbi:MAG: NUDIX hydrolase [Opitutales bacterium]